MRLIELRVRNFRGLGGENNVINFRNNNIIFLIGQNNVGKSSFLHAYTFFTDSKKKAEYDDFFKYDSSSPIEIEGDFEKEDTDDNNSDFSKEPDWIDKWVQEESGLITIKKVWSAINTPVEKYTKDKSGTFIKNGFGGFDSLFQKYSPQPIFVNAVDTVENLEKALNDIIEKEQIKNLETNFPKQYEAGLNAINEIQKCITNHATVIDYNQRINKSFQKVFPALKLKISIKNDDGIDLSKAFKTNHSIDVQKEGDDRKETFDHYGHGVIRQAFFNFLTFLKTNSTGTKKEYLLLFEEPELFLHPKSTRMLREELYNLANTSPFQILCCTHCPQMIDISKPHCSLVRIEKINHNEKTKTYQIGHDVFQSGANKNYIQMVNRFDPNICECFYSSHVIIVEGDTEAIICREILDSKYRQKDIFVLNSGSKNNIPFFQRVLNHFHIPYTVIHDSDYRYLYNDGKIILNNDGQTKKKNSAWAINESIWQELEIGKEFGINVHRLVSVHSFEPCNGYTYSPVDGKPLSAYKFARENLNNEKVPIINFIEQIVMNDYKKDWTASEMESISEPY